MTEIVLKNQLQRRHLVGEERVLVSEGMHSVASLCAPINPEIVKLVSAWPLFKESASSNNSGILDTQLFDKS